MTDALVARGQVLRVQIMDTSGNYLRKKIGVDTAQAGLKKIPQPLHHDAKQCAITRVRDQSIQQGLRPGSASQAMLQQFLGELIRRGTFQPATPAFYE